MHATLMSNGRVLFFSGYYEGNIESPYSYQSWEFDADGLAEVIKSTNDPIEGAADNFYATDLNEQPILEAMHQMSTPELYDKDPDVDLFCSHHVSLSDGRVLVVGGDSKERAGNHDNRGLHLHNPLIHGWKYADQRMKKGRWYPTVVTLPDGRAAVFGGEYGPVNDLVDIVDSGGNGSLETFVVPTEDQST